MTPSAGPAPARPWQHRWDPFLDRDAADAGAEKQAELDGAILDDSPYPEVRAAVTLPPGPDGGAP